MRRSCDCVDFRRGLFSVMAVSTATRLRLAPDITLGALGVLILVIYYNDFTNLRNHEGTRLNFPLKLYHTTITDDGTHTQREGFESQARDRQGFARSSRRDRSQLRYVRARW